MGKRIRIRWFVIESKPAKIIWIILGGAGIAFELMLFILGEILPYQNLYIFLGVSKNQYLDHIPSYQ